MKIDKKQDGNKLELKLEGRLDTTTSSELEEVLHTSLTGITELEIDFESLQYISSAGLRVILTAEKMMSKAGTLVIKNVNDTVMEVFEITGFVNILTIV